MEKKVIEIQKNALLAIQSAKEQLKEIYGDDKSGFDNQVTLLLTIACLTRFNELIETPNELRDYKKLLDFESYLNNKNILDDNLRPNWDEYFMIMAMMASLRASCYSRKVGAVIVKRKQIISTGYNGALKGLESCFEKHQCVKENEKYNLAAKNFAEIKEQIKNGKVSFTKEKKEYITMKATESCRAYHAEANALGHLVNSNEKVEEHVTEMYVTLFPCRKCAERIINANIATIYYLNEYSNDIRTDKDKAETIKLFEEKGIKVKKLTLRPEIYLLVIFNLLHPEGFARSLIKPNEYSFDLSDFESCPDCQEG